MPDMLEIQPWRVEDLFLKSQRNCRAHEQANYN